VSQVDNLSNPDFFLAVLKEISWLECFKRYKTVHNICGVFMDNHTLEIQPRGIHTRVECCILLFTIQLLL